MRVYCFSEKNKVNTVMSFGSLSRGYNPIVIVLHTSTEMVKYLQGI